MDNKKSRGLSLLHEETWTTDRHDGDDYNKVLVDAVATFGEGSTVRAEQVERVIKFTSLTYS